MSLKNTIPSSPRSSLTSTRVLQFKTPEELFNPEPKPIIFEKEPEFLYCSTCSVEFFYLKNSKFCHMGVCEKCSMEKIDNKRICDICFVKFQEPKQESRKDEFLEVSKSKIDSLKKRIKEGEKEIEELEREAIRLHSPIDNFAQDSDIMKKNSTFEGLEEEKKGKIEIRNRALKDYEVFYSEFEDLKENECSLNETLKKNLEEQSKLIMSMEYLKQQNLYKDQEFHKLMDEQENLKNSIRDLKERKSFGLKNSEEDKKEKLDTKGPKKEARDQDPLDDDISNRCKFC